ncbi:Gldg family protein [Pedobacter nutrimenti]|uniref:Gldg family protein n=1 Tax=Pedobacter nutrimenti TaxID=1241337 RepID=UPI00293127BD|nr:Gldg family protein [Pedobacter nutrimenti]
MNLIFKIAKAELRNLFYSPIAWFLTIAFMVECAISYTMLINSNASRQEMGGMSLNWMSQLTFDVFTSEYGLFVGIMQNLYLYIPLLTMGLISREINGGTISLLYSSPVKVREIVLGKYLAMLVYSFILLFVIGIFMVSGIFHITSADYGMLLAAALGFYLLLAAYSAIGLFMSSLTSYQIVAAVSTFVMIGVLSYIGTLWQSIDFIRDITYFLSLSGRTSHMLGGLITTNDVIYFILIVFVFLGLTMYKLQSGRETKAWYVNAGRYLAIVITALIIGYVASRPSLIGYWDTTANQDNTLTPNAQKIVKEFGNDKLEVTAYTNFLDNYYSFGLPERRNEYLSRWEIYLRFKPDIDFHYVNYYDVPMALKYDFFASYKGKTLNEIAEQRVKGAGLSMDMFKTPQQIQKEIDLKPELNRFVMKLTYKGRSTFLRVFDDPIVWPMEAEVSAAFKRLLQAEIPKIAFVTGEGERKTDKKGDREYKAVTSAKTFRFALINQGFDIDTLSLGTQEIPDNIKALVIADPQNELSAAATEKIKAYIARGGNLLIAGEPGRQQMLNPLLKTLGVQLMDGMLAQESEDYSPTLVLSHLTKAGIGLNKLLDKPSIDTLPVSMNGVAGLTYRDTIGFHAQSLLITQAGLAKNTRRRNPDLDLVNKKEEVVTSQAGGVAMMAPEGGAVSVATGVRKAGVKKPSTATAGNKDVFTTVLALTRKINGKEQRIIVSGDADLFSNSESQRNVPQVINFNFSTALFSWLDYGQYPVDTSRPDSKDNRVTVSTDHVAFLKVVYIYVIPGLILIFAAIFLIRRKRK